ncbi:putative membrane protein [Thermanaerovibrio velox DSM 12556]|uniref:Putative membrane protein n=1 Tax=Thermanaerovibrio velox DSM 12556 TaxID=926567 RepID=H0UQL3_9BACT|nr:putative basic amino acid antiporter YfcC [Thermanaerovibrio velox]EHM10777.1 putative membrane protein [Thermanaerovibrio velox DSM 12556]
MSGPSQQDKKNKTTWMLDTYIIIFLVVAFMAALTYVVPVGKFETHEVKYTVSGKEKSRTVLKPETFTLVKDEAGSPLKKGIKLFEPGGEVGFLNYAFEGLVSGDKWGSAVGVVAFILIIGGAFGIILRTGAVENGIMAIINKLQGKEILLLPILFVLFSLGGAVFGMGEEAIPFVMILCPVCVAMGYDSVTAILVSYVATQIGFATSWMNPFSVAIAQGVSQIPVLSAAGFRIAMWGFFTLFGIAFTIRYARKVKANPETSISYKTDEFFRKDISSHKAEGGRFTLGHGLVVLTVAAGIAWVIWGVVQEGYYIPEIATQFFVMGLLCGIIGVLFKLEGMRVNDIATSFRKGAEDLVGAALVVGMAKGIVLVLGGTDPSNPTVLNTVLHYTGEAFKGLPAAVSAWFMYIFQSCFNFFVVSGSGQAALTMPLMAPLSDILGVSRQVAVLAFQLGDGFTNLIVPTSGVLMACLGAARIDWTQWARWQIKFQGLLFFFGSLFVIGGVLFGLK